MLFCEPLILGFFTHAFRQSARLETTRRELETQPAGARLQHRRHARLHCAGGVPADRLRSGVRLVVAGRHHVRDADGLSAVLQRQSAGHVPQGDELARNAHFSAGDADFGGGQRDDRAVLLRGGPTDGLESRHGRAEERAVLSRRRLGAHARTAGRHSGGGAIDR